MRKAVRTPEELNALLTAELRRVPGCEGAGWVTVEVKETTRETYRQERRGRPSQKTRYKKQERTRFEIEHRVALERLDAEARCDRVFPLVSNDLTMTERALLLTYKHQPAIERRFEQLKTDFVVAPVYLKEASRIQALLCVYFVVLLVEALLERELRGAMERCGDEDLPLYPESRPCRRPSPTARPGRASPISHSAAAAASAWASVSPGWKWCWWSPPLPSAGGFVWSMGKR